MKSYKYPIKVKSPNKDIKQIDIVQSRFIIHFNNGIKKEFAYQHINNGEMVEFLVGSPTDIPIDIFVKMAMIAQGD